MAEYLSKYREIAGAKTGYRRNDSGHILKVELIGFADGFADGCKRTSGLCIMFDW